MKRILILLFAVGAIQASAQKINGKLIIIGGGSRPDALVERIIDESKLRTGGFA